MEKEIVKTEMPKDEDVFVFGTKSNEIAEQVESFVKQKNDKAVVIRLEDKFVTDFLDFRKKQQNKQKEESIEDYVANEDNRTLAMEKALLLWNIMTNNADVVNASKRIFQKSEIVKKTTLTHKALNELLDTLSLFGFIEYPNGVNYEFRMIFTPQVRLSTLYADMIEIVAKLNEAITCYKVAIDKTEEETEKEKRKEQIKEVIEQLIKY